MEDLTTLVSMLFNLGFKHCKYCNKLFYPQHNRQVHCCEQHRIWYRNERKRERRRKQRKNEPRISFIDGHGNYIQGQPRQLFKLGSLFSNENYKRKLDFTKEAEDIRKQKQLLGLR